MPGDRTVFEGRHVVDEVGKIIRETLTREHLHRLFSRLQQPIPSGTELHTAPPAIRILLDELKVPVQTFTADILGLEFPALFMGNRAPDMLFAAHADEISYIVPRPTNRLELGPDNLVPNFAHRPQPGNRAASPQGYPAAVVRWCGPARGYQVVGSGTIHWTAEDIRPGCTLTALEGTPESGDRIVYAPPVVLDQGTGLLTGKVDNRGGVAACIAMCDALTRIAGHLGVPPVSFQVGVLFPGQEEGTIGKDGAIELAFSRDSRAAGMSMAVAGLLPRAWINVDGHDIDPPAASGLYTPIVSEARGTVVPPHVLSQYREFFETLAQEWGIDMRQTPELGGTVSRSDDSGMLGVIPKRIIPFGFSVRNPHYNAGLPTTHIDSLVQLASALTWLAVAFHGVPRTGAHLQIDRSRAETTRGSLT
jgi:hypothetical protein